MGQYVLRFYYKDTGASTTMAYSRYNPYLEQGRGQIISNGSTTTVTSTAVTTGISASYDPLTPVAAGDILVARYGLGSGAEYIRKITAKASNASITVDSAVDFTDGTTAWGFFQKKSGTTEWDGVHTIASVKKKTFVLNVNTLGSTSIDFSLEGRSGGGADSVWTPIWTQNVAATGKYYFPIQDTWTLIRLGNLGNTPGTDSFDAYLICEEN